MKPDNVKWAIGVRPVLSIGAYLGIVPSLYPIRHKFDDQLNPFSPTYNMK